MKHKNVDISKQIISMDKKYETRDGRPARVLCVDKGGDMPVVAIIGDYIEMYYSDGRWTNEEPVSTDLIEIKEEKPLWVTVWINSSDQIVSCSFAYEEEHKYAINLITEARLEILATKKITYTEGERIDE